MTSIMIADLRPAGAELFLDSDSYLNELTDAELNMTHGGSTPTCVLILTLCLVAGCDHPQVRPLPPPVDPNIPGGNQGGAGISVVYKPQP